MMAILHQALAIGVLLYAMLANGYHGPYNYGATASNLLLKRQNISETIVITNLTSESEIDPPARVELRELKKDSYKWNLYLLALSMFQWTETSRPDSWYQIAGIHGYPFASWNGVEGINPWTGYCPHSSILFPTWHRPYMALVEQQLYYRVQFIASLFQNETERALYQRAASVWRMPYWDWARRPLDGAPVFMEEFGLENIRIYGPNGWQLVANPLYSFHFTGNKTLDFPAQLREWNETKRAPSDQTAGAVSRSDEVANQLDLRLDQLQQRLFMLFSSYHNYTTFSNIQHLQQENGKYESIEAIHNAIHLSVGQGGHMDYIMYSAFDPIFFLHHANVDRLVAMWQALNPSSWVMPLAASAATFTTDVGEIQDSNTHLKPFYTSGGQFWNSELSRDTRSFGYVYDDTANVSLTGQSATEALEELKRVINEKYGQSSPSAGIVLQPGLRAIDLSTHSEMAEKFRKDAVANGRFTPNLSSHGFFPNPPFSAIMEKGNRYTEWIANIKIQRKDIDRPMSILFFIGDVPDGPKSWKDSPNVAGSFGVFSMAAASNPTAHITGTLPLTSALTKMVAAGFVHSMDPEDMSLYLEHNLKFRVLDANHEIVDLGRTRGLSITIASASVKAPLKNTGLPEWDSLVERFTLM